MSRPPRACSVVRRPAPIGHSNRAYEVFGRHTGSWRGSSRSPWSPSRRSPDGTSSPSLSSGQAGGHGGHPGHAICTGDLAAISSPPSVPATFKYSQHSDRGPSPRPHPRTGVTGSVASAVAEPGVAAADPRGGGRPALDPARAPAWVSPAVLEAAAGCADLESFPVPYRFPRPSRAPLRRSNGSHAGSWCRPEVWP